MPSIRIRNSRYLNIRDVFDDEGSPATPIQSPEAPTPFLRSAQSTPQFRDRPTSSPLQQPPNLNDTPLVSPILSPRVSENNRSSRRRSNSRVSAHVLSTYSTLGRSNQWSTEGQGSSSTDALNPVGTPRVSDSPLTPHIIVRRPSTLTVEGSQANVTIQAEGGTPGILERRFPEHAYAGKFSPRSDQDDDEDHHHDDIVEHLDVIDPQVGTFSSLTNAANSIVLPPLGFSRKPMIVLSSPRPRSKQDIEKHGEQFEDALDRHVDDVLKSPSKWRRMLMGVWSFLKTPMGILTGIYGFLVVFWGAAIVFFLAKFINFHNANTQGFWVEVSSQVVCGLFTVTSVGFIPSRVLSTWRIGKIWRYKKLTIKRRKAAGLPQLLDLDDLPDPAYDRNFVRVLSEEEHHDLHRQQIKFAYHQTWYRAHGTETHRAFPITMALWICLLNDLNSVFQIILCGTMWFINRPAWSTGILIPAGFLCGIGAAVVIWRGGERTKRVEEVRERLRAALAAEAPRSRPSSTQGTAPRKAAAQLSPVVEKEQEDVIPLQASISRRTPGHSPPSPPTPKTEDDVLQVALTQAKSRTPGGTVKFTASKPLPPMPPDSPELAIDEAMTVPSLRSSTL
ncbi:hypothetical protein FA13DRAFT_1788259 [Coprinellus micaceus]|uniref:Uncharacterized protein n=1 Tax=Coprinellus micaceus TaxID=71717 RepID=A0A4Y7TPZ1_COPMI|nr:hypothetical protein FA13DRAFT_1788259 [Coprinellus micaceus]